MPGGGHVGRGDGPVLAHEPPVALPQSRQDEVDGRRGDHEHGQEQGRDEDRAGADRGDEGAQRVGGEESHVAAGAPERLLALARGRLPQEHVREAGAGDDGGAQPDRDAVVGRGVLGVAEAAQGEAHEGQRQHQGRPAEGPREDLVHRHGGDRQPRRGRAGQVPPLDGRGEQAQQQQEEGAAVAQRLRGHVRAQGAHAAHGAADHVGEGRPDASDGAGAPGQGGARAVQHPRGARGGRRGAPSGGRRTAGGGGPAGSRRPRRRRAVLATRRRGALAGGGSTSRHAPRVDHGLPPSAVPHGGRDRGLRPR